MGYTTDFIGHIDITPPLNYRETTYLTAFADSRRWDRPEGPYAVPGNPRVDESHDDHDRYNRPAPGAPELWCKWSVCSDGDCLTWSGHEKFYRPVEWLTYLIDHFLRPGAHAIGSDEPHLQGFTFNHHLSGAIVGCRRDTRELFTIEVHDNVVSKRVLRRGDPLPWELPMAYEEMIDRERAARSRRRNRNLGPGAVAAEGAEVVALVRRPR